MTLEETIRAAVRDEVRAALRDMLTVTTPASPPTTGGSVYLTTSEAAALAAVRPETIRKWVQAGKLPEHHAGRELRVRRDQLEALMAHGADRAATEVDLDTKAREIVAGRIGKARWAP